MAESNRDDLADALARLAGGDVDASGHEEAPPKSTPVPAPVPTPTPVTPRAVRPASTRPAAPRPAGVAQPPRPTAPVPAAMPTPAPPPLPPARARPVSPSLANAAPVPPPAPPVSPKPVIRPVAPAAKKARPAAPTVGQRTAEPSLIQPDMDGGQSNISDQPDPTVIIDDDDMMNIPASDALTYQPRPKNSADARAKAAARKSLELRRTLIPILLTCGVMMIAFASLKFLTGADSVLAAVPILVPVLLGVGAAIMLALAVVNMLSVKQQMEENKK